MTEHRTILNIYGREYAIDGRIEEVVDGKAVLPNGEIEECTAFVVVTNIGWGSENGFWWVALRCGRCMLLGELSCSAFEAVILPNDESKRVICGRFYFPDVSTCAHMLSVETIALKNRKVKKGR